MNERALFEAALHKKDPEQRLAYLNEACGADQTLRHHIEGLLKAHEMLGSFLVTPPRAPASTMDGPTIEHPGTVIGPYKLMEKIGEGGMGLVFVAEQQQPVRRKVALKVIKPGMDTRQVIARFEAERQALALMDHPNIAKVLDAGTTSDRPYFVMELVKGVPITEYCDQTQLTTRERLELFLPVCHAVQHAHQKGIIHRDIKPTNVLVTLHDGTPVPKIIDFGIAKAMGHQLTDKTIYTNYTQLVGTPLYMSPEQAALSGLDVDTRSDIYSLGVLQYELLTGTTPFNKERLRTAGYDEMRRIIREEDPPRPSTRISTLTKSSPDAAHAETGIGSAPTTIATIATQRKSDPKRLSQLFRGELDWIVMKALEKDRNRRYETATAFAADVQHYLADEPVQACPPSAFYRFRKFVRRNKASLAVVASVLAMSLALAGAEIWFGHQKAVQETRIERAATAALSQVETFLEEGDKQTEHPERWQATAQQAQSALEKAEELLATGAGTEELADRVKQIRAAVDAAVTDSRMLVELDGIRLEQASVKAGRFDKARAAPLYAGPLGNYHVNISEPEAAAARVQGSRLRQALLAALADWRRITPDDAERQRLEQVLLAAEPPNAFRNQWRDAARRRDAAELLRLAKDPSLRQWPAAVVVDLALDLQEMKEWDAAERLLRSAQERNPADFWVNHDLGRVLLNSRPHTQAGEAVGFLRAALALRSDSAIVHHDLGAALAHSRDFDSAIREYQSALQIDPRYAAPHRRLFYAFKAKGEMERASQEIDAAIREYRETIQIDPKDAAVRYNLGEVLWEIGDPKGAFQEFQTAALLEPNNAGTRNYLGLCLQKMGRLDDAVSAFQKATLIDPKNASAHNHLAGALYDKHDLDGAIREWREAVELEPNYAVLHSNLGWGLAAKGDVEGAIREYRQAIHMDPECSDAAHNLAELAANGGDREELIQQLRTAIQTEPELASTRQYFLNACAWRLAISPNPSARDAHGAVELARQAVANASKGVNFFGTLGVAYYRNGEYQAAATELSKAIELFGKEAPQERAIDALFLAMTHWQLGNHSKARQWYDQALEWAEKNHLNPRDDELRRFRTEAEELLRIRHGPVGGK
jgi:serine/threonine protein kinase/tetratricopeptide (TPR) repeat protein